MGRGRVSVSPEASDIVVAFSSKNWRSGRFEIMLKKYSVLSDRLNVVKDLNRTNQIVSFERS
jgi:hypothetical protein